MTELDLSTYLSCDYKLGSILERNPFLLEVFDMEPEYLVYILNPNVF